MIMNELNQVSRKMQASSHILANKLKEIEDDLGKESTILENFFHSLGEALCLDEDEGTKPIIDWVKTYRSPQVHFPIRKIRHILLDFIEEELNNGLIHPASIMKLIKKVDFYIDYASTILLNNVGNDAAILYDERIAIRELNELKNSLKEATILTISDKNDRIIYANKKFCQITQYTMDELIGSTHRDLVFSGYHDNHFFDEIWKAIKSGEVWKGEVCNKTKDGTFYWVDTTIVPFQDCNGETYRHITIQHDITEKKQTEEMLRKTEKLSFVGELAAGFAHEIRNPLTTIRGFVQILDSFTEEKRHLYSKTILDEIDRINFIVSEFMVFSKPHAVKFSACHIVDMVKNVVQFLGAEATLRNVKITHIYSDKDIYIYGEKHQLIQVFLNMVKNAMDALPNGGEITLSYAYHQNEISILIKDNGVGMTKEQIGKIGQPFFTTKEKGNGLGLMVSYKIIENHRGRINVISAPGEGTTFIVTFPVMVTSDVQ